MCTQQRYIFNPYARRNILVPCGHCAACQQEKAARRATRIRNNASLSTIALFITLTYTNDYVPYISRDELFGDGFDINIYRRSKGRFVFSKKRGLLFKKEDGTEIIDSVYLPSEFRSDSEVSKLLPLKGLGSDKIGVCLNSDFQKFIKRLKQIVIRDYGINYKWSYFYCSEYGSITHRPHFHALIFIQPHDEEFFRSAVVKAWPYADTSRTKNYVEIAKDAASYVSSYVNSHLGLCSALSFDKFKSSHHASNGFGVVLDCFNLSEILQKIDKGDLHYYIRKKFDGDTSLSALPIPVYVLHRYFPKYKGFGWLTSCQLHSILLDPSKVGTILNNFSSLASFESDGKLYNYAHTISHKLPNMLYDFSPKESYKIYVALENCYQRFHAQTGLSRYDYAFYYERCWDVYKSNILRDSYKDIETLDDFCDFYENSVQLIFGEVSSPTLASLTDLVIDPNARSYDVLRTQKFTDLYYKLDKQKKVTNYVLSSIGHNF